MKVDSEEQQLMKEIAAIVYPSYPLACSAQQFLAHYQPLFDALRRFDQATDLLTFHQLPLSRLRGAQGSVSLRQQQEITDHIVMTIIDILNKSCSHCHRKEYSQRIFLLLGEFKGNLKDLAIGKTPIRFSNWFALLDSESPTSLYYAIKEPEVLSAYDQLFQEYHYIPHRETFLLNYTGVAMAMQRFEVVMRGMQNSLPPQHQHYLAIIASATYGCKYLWSRSVADFLRAGGDLAWIEEGSVAVPAILKEMSRYSTMVAYNFKQLDKEHIFGSSNSSEHEYRLIALIWLCYYQALACIDLVCGFIPEKYDYFQYLPDLPAVRPSIGSFEAVKRTEGMDSLHEIRAAEEFANLYSWDDREQEIQVKIEGARSITLSHSFNSSVKRIQSLPDLRDNQIYLLGRAESDQICEKISNLQSLKYLQSVFDKYVHFQPLLSNFSCRTTRPLLEDSLVLASDWDFELKGLNRIELVLGSKVRQSLQSLVSALRVQDSDKSKQLKHYYQFFNNYMYEYQSYTKLMKSISINEKNYLKLVTKSPFLFTEQAFQRMKNDLAKVGSDPLDFLMEAVSFKFELSVNLLSFLLDRTEGEDD